MRPVRSSFRRSIFRSNVILVLEVLRKFKAFRGTKKKIGNRVSDITLLKALAQIPIQLNKMVLIKAHLTIIIDRDKIVTISKGNEIVVRMIAQFFD